MPSALVTGGLSGIGLCDRADAARGGVRVDARRAQGRTVEAAAAELDATSVAVDVRSEEDCARLVATHLEAHGGLRRARQLGRGRHRRPDRRHADGALRPPAVRQPARCVLVTREALPALREARGYVVNLASIAGTIPTPGLASYGAAKAALISLTRSLAREEVEAGVRVTALCPAFVDTPMTTWTGIDGGEMIQPEDCAELVRALLRMSPAARVPVVVIERAGDDV